MMGQQTPRQAKLFYYGLCLEDRVPPDHLRGFAGSGIKLQISGWLHTPLRTERWFPHTSTPHPRTNPQGRFRGVDATHGPAAGPASQQWRMHLRRSPEAVHGPNPF